MKARSIKGSSTDEIRIALEENLADGYQPTLAIVFISIRQDRKAVAALLQQKQIDVFGATSCGEFIEGYQSEGEIVILLLDLSRDAYTILFEEVGNRTVEETASIVAQQALQKFKHPTLILSSTGVNSKGEYFDGVSLVSTMEAALGKEKMFYGGMAGDDFTFTGTYVFTADKETDCGVVAIVMDEDKLSLQGMAISGWRPMGISRKITKSSGNLVYTIDDTPAVDMYFKYLGKSEKTDDKSFDVLNELSFHFPFITDRGDGETIIKSPMKIDHTENALVMDMEMPEGSTFWFCTPPDFEISEQIIQEASELKNAAGAEADALLIFSCAGRPPVLGPLVALENDGIAGVWQTPMAGFFTYGEFGRTKNGRQHFHSSVCSWVAIKEK